MKKTILQLTALLLIAVTVLSMSACGTGVRVRAVDVENDTFFEESYREYLLNDGALPEDGKYYPLAQRFFENGAQEYMQKFLWRYDSNTGMALVIEVTNSSKETVHVTGIKTENNGYLDTYVPTCVGLNETVDIPAGETAQVRVCFVGNGGLYTNEDFINTVFREMPMTLVMNSDSGAILEQKVRLKSVKDEL